MDYGFWYDENTRKKSVILALSLGFSGSYLVFCCPTDRPPSSGRVGSGRREDATRRSRSTRTKHACARGDDGRVVRERERAAEEPDETDDEADAESDGWTKG